MSSWFFYLSMGKEEIAQQSNYNSSDEGIQAASSYDAHNSFLLQIPLEAPSRKRSLMFRKVIHRDALTDWVVNTGNSRLNFVLSQKGTKVHLGKNYVPFHRQSEMKKILIAML